MAKKDFLKKAAQKNKKVDKATDLGKMIDQKSRNKNIIIHPELKPFIPALLDDEKELLEESIKIEGVREKIVLWKDTSKENDYIIVDGHNRYEIVQKLKEEGVNVSYGFREQEFESIESVKYWMIINQFSRRNLTDKQRTYLMGLRYEMEKQGYGGNRNSSPKIWDLNKTTESLRTSEKLAGEFNVSKNTIENASVFAQGIDKLEENLKQDVLKGSEKINKSDIQKLAKVTVDEKIESVDQIKELIKPQPKKKKPTPKKRNPLKSAINKSKEQLFLVITGTWLLEHNLGTYWAEKRGIKEDDINNSFEDKISIKEAIKLGMIRL